MHPNHLSWIAEHQDVVYMIEANSFESMSLWREYNEALEWKECTSGGPMFQLGELDSRPIVLGVNIIKVDGRKVMFYDPTSQVVDWVMVEDFLEKSWPNAKKTNAMNFFNAVHYIRDLNNPVDV